MSSHHLSERLLTNVGPSGQDLKERIVVRQPLMLVVVHDGLITGQGRVNVHAPHFSRPQDDGMGRQIQRGVLVLRRTVLPLVDLDPISLPHGDLSLDGPGGEGLLAAGRLGFGG